MKNFIKSTVKYLYLWIIFSVSVLFTVYAANITWVTGQTISNGDTIWNGWFQDVNNSIVPGWAVMAFNLPSCPTGWSEYTTARGRTIIWAGNWADSNTSVGDTGWEKSSPEIDVKFNLATNWSNNDTFSTNSYFQYDNFFGTISNSVASQSFKFYNKTGFLPEPTLIDIPWLLNVTWAGTAPDNMQPYVSLLYCQKS